MEDKDSIIRQQGLIMADQTNTINQLRTELAYHRQWEHRIACPWSFFWWLLLQDVWPFRLWYGRFDGGQQ